MTLEADSGYCGRTGKDIDRKRVWSGGRMVFDVLFFLEWSRSYIDIHSEKIHWAVSSCFVHFLVLCGCVPSCFRPIVYVYCVSIFVLWRYFLISLLISSLIQWLFKIVLFNFHVSVNFSLFYHYLFIVFFSPLWLEKILEMILILNTLRFVLWPGMWSVLKKNAYEECVFYCSWVECSVDISSPFAFK